jgi:uncharacterized membrane protein
VLNITIIALESESHIGVEYVYRSVSEHSRETNLDDICILSNVIYDRGSICLQCSPSVVLTSVLCKV